MATRKAGIGVGIETLDLGEHVAGLRENTPMTPGVT
jgi:hypothetical protein